jgi:Protein of unknown function (DUF998)
MTQPARPGLVPGWTVVSAGLAPVLATAGWLVGDPVQPASYSPIRKTVSVLAGHAGTDRWVSPEPVRGSTPQHLAWTALGAVALAVWPAFVARRAPPRPLILSGYGCAAVTAVFLVLLGWLVIQTQGGADLGLAERLTTSTEICWPFVVAVALRRTNRPRTDPGYPITAAIRSRHNRQAAGRS